jgi:hypothetical protein
MWLIAPTDAIGVSTTAEFIKDQSAHVLGVSFQPLELGGPVVLHDQPAQRSDACILPAYAPMGDRPRITLERSAVFLHEFVAARGSV